MQFDNLIQLRFADKALVVARIVVETDRVGGHAFPSRTTDFVSVVEARGRRTDAA